VDDEESSDSEDVSSDSEKELSDSDDEPSFTVMFNATKENYCKGITTNGFKKGSEFEENNNYSLFYNQYLKMMNNGKFCINT